MSAVLRGLYAIADTAAIGRDRLVPAVERAIDGGARLVQYRHKQAAGDPPAAEVRSLRALCRARGIPFIVNDDVALALALDADGVHLGRDDGPLRQAREALGTHRLIGASCYNRLHDALRARDEGADYVAFGSFFPSAVKPDAVRATPDLIAAARRSTGLPVVAIGGITPENGASLIAAGADALAVISGVFAQDDIEAAARRYAALFDPVADDPLYQGAHT